MNRKPQDPVCGSAVDTPSSRRQSFAGQEYYFCSDTCLTQFQADPARFLESPRER